MSDVRGLADWVKTGETTSVEATVANTGLEAVTKTLTVTIDGESVAEKTVTLQSGERTSVPIQFEAQPGTVAVDGRTVGTLESSEQFGEQGVEPDTEESNPDTMAGFGPVLAVLAFVGAGIALWRYRG